MLKPATRGELTNQGIFTRSFSISGYLLFITYYRCWRLNYISPRPDLKPSVQTVRSPVL